MGLEINCREQIACQQIVDRLLALLVCSRTKWTVWFPKQFRCFILFAVGYLAWAHVSNNVYVKGQVGLIRLHHAYANLISSSSRGKAGALVKGINKEVVELFRQHDIIRHSRMLPEVVQFPVGGSANPYVAGIYFTRVKLGTPPREYHVQVDTGSDLLWLNCNPCMACPRISDLEINLVPYDPGTSTTSSMIGCKSSLCSYAVKVATMGCKEGERCEYTFLYGDGSSTMGYLVSDTLVYTTVQPNNSLADAAAKIVFGCGYSQSGNLLTAQNVVDGIMGFGQNPLSVISQLYSQRLSSGIFAHCLEGSEKGGGVLVLGHVGAPGLVFTPIVGSQPHYNVNLRAISVNDIQLSIGSSAQNSNGVQGTIFDSGTTLAYLVEAAYTSFIKAIIKAAPNKAQVVSQQETTCFVFSGSVDDEFPTVILHFEAADMRLKASHYLIQQSNDINIPLWCIAWRSITSSPAFKSPQLTILGDIVLKDQLIVYDLENQRIGWVDFDCSQTIVVSSDSGKEESITAHDIRNHATILQMKLLLVLFISWWSMLWLVGGH